MPRKLLIVTKPAKCACCGEMMETGEAFRWYKGKKSVPDFSRRSMGTIKTIDTFRPSHVHNCGAEKVKAQLDANALDLIERACAMAARYGENPEWIAKYRVKLLQEAGL